MKKSAIIMSVLAFILAAPLVYFFMGLDMIGVVYAYHAVDVPPRWDYFSFLYGASWSIPVVWFVCLVLLLVELFRRRRGRLLAAYVGVPVVFGVAFWLVLQGYLVLVTRFA